VLLLVFGGCGIYFYLQGARAEHEAQARSALLAAQTPEALVQVADQFPGTTHAAMALIAAGNLSYDQKDYASAENDFQRVAGMSGLDDGVRDSARLGYAAALQAAGAPAEQAADAYLAVAQRGKASPFASYAYLAAAHLYERQHNLDKEKQLLLQATAIDTESTFGQQAQKILQSLQGGPSATPEP
jgi:hypothetical protein